MTESSRPIDIIGGYCRDCGGPLVSDQLRFRRLLEIRNKVPRVTLDEARRISDSMVPHLLCLDCGRQIRKEQRS